MRPSRTVTRRALRAQGTPEGGSSRAAAGEASQASHRLKGDGLAALEYCDAAGRTSSPGREEWWHVNRQAAFRSRNLPCAWKWDGARGALGAPRADELETEDTDEGSPRCISRRCGLRDVSACRRHRARGRPRAKGLCQGLRAARRFLVRPETTRFARQEKGRSRRRGPDTPRSSLRTRA